MPTLPNASTNRIADNYNSGDNTLGAHLTGINSAFGTNNNALLNQAASLSNLEGYAALAYKPPTPTSLITITVPDGVTVPVTSPDIILDPSSNGGFSYNSGTGVLSITGGAMSSGLFFVGGSMDLMDDGGGSTLVSVFLRQDDPLGELPLFRRKVESGPVEPISIPLVFPLWNPSTLSTKQLDLAISHDRGSSRDISICGLVLYLLYLKPAPMPAAPTLPPPPTRPAEEKTPKRTAEAKSHKKTRRRKKR